MKRTGFLLLLTTAMALVSAAPSDAQKRRIPLYKIEVLGGGVADPFRINDQGVISGHLGSDAVLIFESGVEVLWRGRADDINASGQVVGSSDGQAVTMLDGAGTVLGAGAARGLNDAGDIVGHSGAGATLWRHDGTEVLLANVGTSDIVAEDINNVGLIVGAGREFASGPYHAVIWEEGLARLLPALAVDGCPGDFVCGSRAHRINSSGHVVGTSDVPSGTVHAVIWIDDDPVDLGTLGGSATASEGRGINDAGWAVGDSDSRAFVFNGTQMYDLITLIRGRNPFTGLTTAQSINNNGDIVGVGLVGGELRGFLARRMR